MEDAKCFKLSHAQMRVWYVNKINPESPLNNIGGSIVVKNKLYVEKMRLSINLLIKNNHSLRIRIIEKNGKPMQFFEECYDQNIEVIDFNNRFDKYECWVNDLFKQKFNLKEERLYRFYIAKINDEHYEIVFVAHHIICDGWSMSLLQKYLCDIYNKNTDEHKDELIDKYTYMNYVEEEEEYFKSERFVENRKYWNKKFKDVDNEFLYNSCKSLESKRKVIKIDDVLSKKIKKYIQKEKCSLNTFFLAVMFIYENKIKGSKDTIIGTPIFNRSGSKQKQLIGMFTSTVPIRYTVNPNEDVKKFISSINKELRFNLVNQKYPYDMLINDLKINEYGYDSLFKICVNYYNSDMSNNIDGIKVDNNEFYCGNQSYSLQLTIKEWEESNLIINIDYKVADYLEDEILSMYKYINNIINQIVNEKEIKVKDIELLEKEEIERKLYELNNNKNILPEKTIIELFEECVENNKEKIALEYNDNFVTYEELNKKSNQFANYLINRGIYTNKIVGIMMTHSNELIVAILGTLKAGASYVPIDPTYPTERVNYILDDANISLLLINNNYTNSNIEVINVDNINLSNYSNNNLEKANSLDDLAYLIYTSGSTGKPKGVMIEHKGLANYITFASKKYLTSDNEVMPLYSSISFDLTVTAIFAPLITGSKIIIYRQDKNEFILYRIFRENKVTAIKLTPAHLILIKDLDNTKSNIKTFIVGGDDLKTNIANDLINSFGREINIYNEYGPTEAVVGCMIYRYDEDYRYTSVPIGKAIDNNSIYILDKDQKVVSDYKIGEIYISSYGLARGYLNKEEYSKEKFIPNIYVEGLKMYRTGDLAKYSIDGVIHYCGRIDNQVKIRGHRIEIGEIERNLLTNKVVKDAVVNVIEDKDKNKQLCAYVVKNKETSVKELRNHLSKFVNNYMIPNQFIFIDNIPLTSNGKIDYKSLPVVETVREEFVGAQNEIQAKVVNAVSKILNVNNVGINDNYFQLGGDSIKAIQISSLLKQEGINLNIKDILSNDTIAKIADMAEVKQIVNISQELADGSINNTPILKWFFNMKFNDYNQYNQYVLIKCNKAINIDYIKLAFRKMVEHFDELRINYDKVTQKLYYNNNHLNDEINIQTIKADSDFLNKDNTKFDIEKSLLFNITNFVKTDGKSVLLFKLHHLIVDGVSWRILITTLFNIIEMCEKDKPIEMPLKTHSYKVWSEYLQKYAEEIDASEKLYWNDINNGDYGKQINRQQNSCIQKVTFNIDEAKTKELISNVADIYNLKINDILLILLVISTNQLEVAIEVERHGRENIDENIYISRTVGWFTSMFPILFKVNDGDINSKIKDLKEQLNKVPNNGFNYSFLYPNQEKRYIRFNYLGDFDSIINNNVINIESGLDNSKDNFMTSLIDVDTMIINKCTNVSISYDLKDYSTEEIDNFVSRFVENINLLIDSIKEKGDKEFTPSDFESADINQEDLDSLFI